jgi:type IV pilus assembly protein PilE
MVVIGIAAILVAVGMPIYTSITTKNHRHEATAELLSISNAAENFEIRKGAYPTGNLASSWHQTTTDNGYYSITYLPPVDPSPLSAEAVANMDPAVFTTYTITATAIGSQAGDTECSVIEYEANGAVTNKTPTDCWA